MQVQLGKHVWKLGDRIDGGGFGSVYAASRDDYPDAVAKLVRKAPGASRELLFVDLPNVRNVVPIIDSGATDDEWVLVMPRAATSLLGYLKDARRALDVSEAVPILSDIATALVDLDGRVVHRDLKPANVLLLDGRWCLADFGISRYAEATTAADTLNHAGSPPYVAPERWRGERATSATDVYSFGVIAYEILSGRRPFDGPDFRDQHLHSDPAHLDQVPAALAALVEECLFKAPAARPSPENLLARLGKLVSVQPFGGLAMLQEANRAQAIRRGEAARQESELRSEAERRKDLAQAARRGLASISDALKDAIMENAPSAALSSSSSAGGWSIKLAAANLRFSGVSITAPSPWGSSASPAIDVIAHAELNLKIPTDRYGYEGRSHSLWYCNAHDRTRYGWFETAFMVSPLLAQRAKQDPFAFDPGQGAAKALLPAMASYQVAWPFTPLSVGDLDEFIDRWTGWLGSAAQGQLKLPNSMPERPVDGSWRRQ